VPLSQAPAALRRAATLLALVLAVVVGSAGPAAAHANLLRTTPADGTVLTTAPTDVVLRFSEAVGTSLGALKVLAPDGRRVDTGEVNTRSDSREVVVPLRPGLDEGTYLLLWRVVSEDGHPVSGSSIFSVGRESAVADAGDLGGGSVAGRALGVSRFVAFAGLVVLLGSLVFLVTVDRLRSRTPRVLRLVSLGTAAAAVGTTAAFLLQGPYGAGEPVTAALRPSLLGGVAETRFGIAMITRLVLVVALALALRHWLRRGAGWAPYVAGAAGVGIAVATSVSGHAGVGDLTWLAVPLDTAHLLAAGAWVGGLALLGTVVLTTDDATDLRRLLPRWSRLAATAVAVLVVTGLFASWREVRELPALPRTTYGTLLIGKSEVVLGMLVLGAAGRAFVQRYAGGGGAAVSRLRRSVAWEATVALVVLAVTAALVETTPARSSYSPTFVAHERVGADLMATVRVAPARAGINTLTVLVAEPDGDPAEVPEVSARLTHAHGPGHDAAMADVISVDVPRVAAGRYEQPRVVLPVPGTWRVELLVRTSEIDATTLNLELPVR